MRCNVDAVKPHPQDVAATRIVKRMDDLFAIDAEARTRERVHPIVDQQAADDESQQKLSHFACTYGVRAAYSSSDSGAYPVGRADAVTQVVP